MREILYVNPRKKKRSASKKRTARPKAKRTIKKIVKKGAKPMAKKRRSAKRKAPRRNPAPKRRRGRATAKRVARAAARSFTGLDFKRALKRQLPTQFGMLAANWSAKRFPGFGGEATATDPNSWEWGSYIKAALGSVVAGMLANSFRKGQGQIVLEGGLTFVVNQVIKNELVAGSEWATAQFGEDDYVPDEYLLTGDPNNPAYLAEDGEFYPADERHRLPETSIGYGDVMEPVTSLGALEPVGPLGASDPWVQAFAPRR